MSFWRALDPSPSSMRRIANGFAVRVVESSPPPTHAVTILARTRARDGRFTAYAEAIPVFWPAAAKDHESRGSAMMNERCVFSDD